MPGRSVKLGGILPRALTPWTRLLGGVALGLILGACRSPEVSRFLTEFVEIKKKLTPDSGRVTRLPSQVTQPTPSGPRCLRDQLADPEWLTRQVAEFEARPLVRSPEPLGFQIPTLNFSALQPSAQAWVRQVAPFLGGEGIDLSHCTTTACLASGLYGGVSSTGNPPGPALASAYFYYRYRVAIGAGFVLPGDRQAIEFSRVASPPTFGFSMLEMVNFLRILQSLPEIFAGQPSLKTLHRVPVQAQSQLIGAVRLWDETACGMNLGTRRILLAARCLVVNPEHDIVPGTPGAAPENHHALHAGSDLTHELAHSVDYAIGGSSAFATLSSLSRFSTSAQWVSLSRWRPVISGVSAASVTYRWVSDQAPEGSVSDYARTSPIEDFAESVAHYRIHPGSFRALAPLKYETIKRVVFGGREYDEAGKLRQTQGAFSSAFAAKFPLWVQICLQSSGQDQSWSVFRTCVQAQFSSGYSELVRHVASTEIEACDFLDRPEWRTQLERELERALQRWAQIGEGPQSAWRGTIAAIQEARGLWESLGGRAEIALRCAVDPTSGVLLINEESQRCYQTQLSQALLEVIPSDLRARLGGALEQEVSLVLTEHPLSQATQELQSVFNALTTQLQAPVLGFARNSFTRCLSDTPSLGPAPNDSSTTPHPQDLPLLEPFSGGSQYIRADLLNCINRDFESELVSLTDRRLRALGLALTDASARGFVFRGLKSIALTELERQVTEEVRREALVLEQRRSELQARVSSILLNQNQWLPSRESDLAASCIPEAERAYDQTVSGFTRENAIPSRFVAPAQLRHDWSLRTCSALIALPQVVSRYRSQTTVIHPQPGGAVPSRRTQLSPAPRAVPRRR
jgi:hypothetical protein